MQRRRVARDSIASSRHTQAIGVADDRHDETCVDRDCNADVNVAQQRNLVSPNTLFISGCPRSALATALTTRSVYVGRIVCGLPFGDQLFAQLHGVVHDRRPCPSSAAPSRAGCRTSVWRWFCECLSVECVDRAAAAATSAGLRCRGGVGDGFARRVRRPPS